MRVAWWPHGALIPGWDEVASILRCCCGEIWKGGNVVAVCNVCNHNILAGAQHSKHSGYQLQPACAPHKKHASKFGQFCIVPSCCRKSSPTCGLPPRSREPPPPLPRDGASQGPCAGTRCRPGSPQASPIAMLCIAWPPVGAHRPAAVAAPGPVSYEVQ